MTVVCCNGMSNFGTRYAPACGWTGLAADAVYILDERRCPTCGGALRTPVAAHAHAQTAITHRNELIAIGWKCGPLTTAADGAVSFTVNQPATTYVSGGKTVIKPATTHTRIFDAAGGMTVVR